MAGELVAGAIQLLVELAIAGVDWGLDRHAIAALTPEQRQAMLEGMLFAARFDGAEATEEIRTIEATARQLLGDDAAKVLEAIERARIAASVVAGPEDEEGFVRGIAQRLPETRQRKHMLRAVAFVACASPNALPRQREVVGRFANHLGLGAVDVQVTMAAAEQELAATRQATR